MQFGIFDHMDRSGQQLDEQYNTRLRLMELYERLGFRTYHLAEHHATPLGMAPSPSVFLSSVAQRTSTLRFGPLVYPLAFYHPLRVFEEICMLDNLSGGRLEVGLGQGVSPIEIEFYGEDPNAARERYMEAHTVIKQALTQKRLDFDGKYFKFKGTPIELTTYQQPHPPLWYGVGSPESAAFAASTNSHIVGNTTAPLMRPIIDRYRAEWKAAGKSDDSIPCMGVNRHIVVADTDEKALAIARRVYLVWRYSFIKLWRERGMPPVGIAKIYPDTFDEVMALGFGVAGNPDTVRKYVTNEIEVSGINYLLSRFCVGDMTYEESRISAELFAKEVRPAVMNVTVKEPVEA